VVSRSEHDRAQPWPLQTTPNGLWLGSVKKGPWQNLGYAAAAAALLPALLAAIMVTIGLFLGRDKVSAYAVVLYARWVGYATFLNAGIWWLSKRPGAASAQKDGLYSNHRRLTRSVGHIWAAAACSWSAPTLLSPKAAAASMCALYPANLAQES
jgi:hypothetical protein